MLQAFIPLAETQRLLAEAFANAFRSLPASDTRHEAGKAGWAMLETLGAKGLLAEGSDLGAFESGLLVHEAAKAGVAASAKEMLWTIYALSGMPIVGELVAGPDGVSCVTPVRPPVLPSTGSVTIREVAFCANARWIACPLAGDGSGAEVRLALLDRHVHTWTENPGMLLAGETDARDIVVDAAVLSSAIVDGALFGGADWQRLVQLWLILVAAEQSGICEGARMQAVDYLAVRKQFGQLIGSFQALRQLAVRGLVVSQDVNLAWQYAAMCWDRRDPDAHRAALTAIVCGAPVRSVVEDAVQMHGGIGFTWEVGLHRRLNQAISAELARGEVEPWSDALLQEDDGDTFEHIAPRYLQRA